MRAARYHEYGDPSVLQVETIDRPEPRPDELLVSVRTASVNPTDAVRREHGRGPLPKTTGSDFAGVVEEVGDEVEGFEPGDRVCGTGVHNDGFQGSFAEYVAVPTDIVAELPESVSFEHGAAVALVGVTAWRALLDHAGLEPGETCLIHGGTGGVGHVAVQLASSIGAHVVTTAGSTEHLERAESFGADAAVRYDRDDLLEAVTEVSERGFDVVLDHRAHDYFSFDLQAAAFDGDVVQITGFDTEVEGLGQGRRKNLTVHMMSMSNLVTNDDFPTLASVLRQVVDLVEQGAIQPEIARRYDLDEAAEVHRAVREDSYVGKLVVAP